MLSDICKELRVDESYWDIWGRKHDAPESTMRSILSALGLDASSDDALCDSFLRQKAGQSQYALDAVVVLSVADASPRTEVRLPVDYGDASLSLTIAWEDGERHTVKIHARELIQTDDGRRFLPLPVPLRLGYHTLALDIHAQGQPDIAAQQRLIVAPEHAYLPEFLTGGGRTAGLAVSLYGVRSGRNWGIGDFTDLANLARWAARELHIHLLGLNPLHAIANREPYNLSPYLPLSTYYKNFIYIDVESVPEFETCPITARLVGTDGFQARLKHLRDSELIDYEGVARLKRAALLLLFRHFLRTEWSSQTGRARQFREWISAEGDLLERFAYFSALDEVIHRRDRNVWVWPDWPEEYRNPASPAVAAFARTHWRRILFHGWLQWIADQQLEAAQQAALDAGMAIGLYQDLALATDRCGADLWAHRDFFVEGCRVGSPPDSFAPDGQDWAFPPPHPETHLRDGYRLFAETIRQNTRHAGALRIDHVMRFYRLFWIPEGVQAKDGTYVRERVTDLLRILALESVRGRFLVVGEDLGTCPEEFRAMLRTFGILSYRLYYFEKGFGGMPKRPADFEPHALVSSTTHDLPTLAGFWAGRDIEARRAAGQLDDEWYRRQWHERADDKHKMLDALIRDGFLPPGYPRSAADGPELTGELHNAIIGSIVSTPSLIMLLNQEDLTKEIDQQNLPGTTWQYPNWKRKMKLSLEQLQGDEASGFVAMFRGWLDRSGRSRAR